MGYKITANGSGISAVAEICVPSA